MANIQIVLIDNTHKIDPTLLHEASLALNNQVTQHLTKYWSGPPASVSVAPALAALPSGGWPVFLVKKLPPNEGGYHMDKNNQPYAKVIATPGDDGWTIDASHEIIEMLIDPYGNRMKTSQAIKISGDDVVDADGTFAYLVEGCDPCEANNYAYSIAGIAVSDFITPNFYDATATPGTQYSFQGNIKRPRQLLPGGYISYQQENGAWNQILWVDPDQAPQYYQPPVSETSRSWRAEIHRAMGAKLDMEKHHQRRKEGGLAAYVRDSIAAHHLRRPAKAAREKELRLHYGLEDPNN